MSKKVTIDLLEMHKPDVRNVFALQSQNKPHYPLKNYSDFQLVLFIFKDILVQKTLGKSFKLP